METSTLSGEQPRQQNQMRHQRAHIYTTCLQMVEETLSEDPEQFGCSPDAIARACVYVLLDESCDKDDPLDDVVFKPLREHAHDEVATFVAAVCDDFLASEGHNKYEIGRRINILKARRLAHLGCDLVGF